MSFVIDPTSLSESAIFADLKNFVDTRPDASSWQTYFESDVGYTVLKLLSGLSAFFTYNNIVGRREAYSQYAKNRSSVIGGGQQQGYSAFRGRNSIVTLTITPNFTGTIERFSLVGSVGSQELISLETKVVNLGESTTIQCVVGDLKSDTLQATSNLPSLFRFTGDGTVSNDLRVLVDGNEVDISETVIDIQKFKYIVQTNAVGSVDVFSDNSLNLSTRYDTNSLITLEWIVLKNSTFSDSDFQFNYGTITNINTDSIYQDQEATAQISINSRLYNETQKVIRAREDQPKQLMQLDSNIIDATGEDVSAAVMRLYYLLDTGYLLTDDEKAELLLAYAPFRPFGMAMPLIGDPIKKKIIISVKATLENTLGDPVADIKSITQSLASTLDATINLNDLEKDIEKLSNIKIARPSITGNDWLANAQYEIGEFVKSVPDSGKIYSVFEILYFSGAVEPTWPSSVAGEYIVDGDLVFKSIAKNDTAGIPDWAASSIYRIGDQVKPTTANGFIYEVVETQNKSSSIEPTWPANNGLNPIQVSGVYIIDGDILWKSRPQEGSPTIWSSDTVYTKGSTVIASDQAASDTVGVMFQAYAYLGTSSGAIPSFGTILNQTIQDNNILWVTQDPLQVEFKSGIDGFFEVSEQITLS